MTAIRRPVHGGNVAAIGLQYGIDPAALLDFSANLNPLGPPPSLLRELRAAASDVAELGRYPDTEYRALRAALARQLDVDPEAIVIGNGAAALLGIALAALGVRCCVVPTPAFSEDRHAIATAGVVWSGVALDCARAFALSPAAVVAALMKAGADACLLTNPHNPSGALTEREAILQLARDANARGAATIVDEAFIDYAPEASVTRDAATTPEFITIRSLTKFYAVPALRVGYAVCEPALARRMRSALPSWPVTTLAARALAVSLDDIEYAHRTRAVNAQNRARLVAGLLSLGLSPEPSCANFLLIELPSAALRAPDLTTRMVREAHIVVRDCSSFEGLETERHIRVAVRCAADNARLVAALARILA